MTGRPKQAGAYIALLTGVVIIGISPIFLRLAEAPGIVAGFYRMAIGALAVTPFFLYQLHRRKTPLSKTGIRVAILASFCFAVDMALWASGIMLSGPTTPTLLANTAPIWVGLGAWLIFGERRKRLFWIGLGIAIVGAGIVLGQDLLRSFDVGLGTFLGLLAAVGYGAYQLATQRGRELLDTLSYFWLIAVSTSLFLLVPIIIMDLPLTGYPLSSTIYFLVMGLLVQVVGWLAITYAQGYVPAAIVAPSLLGQPVLTAIFSAILLGESFTPFHALGGVAVLAGVYLVHYSRR